MRSMRSITSSGAAALAVLAALVAAAQPAAAGGGGAAVPACVPRGECVYYSFCRPAPPPGTEWTGGGSGSPIGYEDDQFADDYLGPAIGTGDPAWIEVCNTGTDLYASPYGTCLSCWESGNPELIVCWTYKYTSTVTTTVSVGGNYEVSSQGSSAQSSQSTATSSTSHAVKYGRKCSGAVEVRPC